MSRLLVKLPDKFVFSTSIPVVYSDLNPAKHLAADRVLPLAFETQMRFTKHLGYEDPTNCNGVGLFTVNSQVDHISEALYGDHLNIDMAVVNIENKSLDFVYRIMNVDRHHEVARVKTRIVTFHYQLGKPVEIPDDLKEKLHAAGA